MRALSGLLRPTTALALATCVLLPARGARAQDPTRPEPVRIERARPVRESLPTLRYLRTNLDFLRGRLDRLRAVALRVEGGGEPIDPRFFAYRDLVAAAGAAADSVAAAADADQRRTLFASVAELGALESQLDQMDRLLAAQRDRLMALEADFAGRQHTALAVLVGGSPRGDAPDALAIAFDDGTRVDVPLVPERREALASGAVLEVFHGLIEPREQSFAIALVPAGGAAADSGWVTLTPARDLLNVLRLDLSGATNASGVAGLTATTWRRDDPPAVASGAAAGR